MVQQDRIYQFGPVAHYIEERLVDGRNFKKAASQ
jgi:hypothetical protein